MQALLRFPKENRSAKAREFSARGAAVRAQRRLEKGVDADTLRARALHDARGMIEREGASYGSAGEHHWTIRRTVFGRINQKDFLLDGCLVSTAGVRKLCEPMRP